MKEIFEQHICLKHEDIKRYVQGKMTEKEQYEVEKHLSDCEFCSDAVEGYASIENFEKLDKVLEESRLSPETRKQLEHETKVIKLHEARASRNMFFVKIAAAVLVLLIPVALITYWNFNQGQRMYTNAIDVVPYNFDYTTRTDDSTQMKQEPFFQALQLYDKKEYAKSLVLFRQHLKENPSDKAASFFSGVAYLKNGQTQKAIKELKSIYLDQTSGFHLDATWYLALAKLRTNDKHGAKSLLLILTQTDSYYNQKASELLIALD